MKQKHIIACTGGFNYADGRATMGPIIRYALKLTGKPKPKICYIGTGSGDAADFITMFYDACIGQDVEAAHLELFLKPNVDDVRAFLLEQDVIWVPGGSVVNLLAVWRVHGLDVILREAWEKGIVLTGSSAGSICWHVGGTTDSFGTQLRPVTNGLGFLPYSNGVHYDSEEQRRPLFQGLIADGTLPDGYATDEGVGLHYVNLDLHEVLADRADKFAYRIKRTDTGVEETKLAVKVLT